jgi:hypothetical protein
MPFRLCVVEPNFGFVVDRKNGVKPGNSHR